MLLRPLDSITFCSDLIQVAKENRGAFWKDFMEEYFVEKATLVIETELGGQTEKFRKSSVYCTTLLTATASHDSL